MAKMKFGVKDGVSTDTGFSPYDGPLPKPGVIYPVTQKSAAVRLTGDTSKNPGTPYIRSMWEVTSGECKGFTVWHNVVPGEADIQQARVAQYMQAVCGKNAADLTHDDIDDGGKITKVGTRNPVGVQAGMTFQRKRDTYGVPEGEEAPWKAESNDIVPGWKPKGGGNTMPLPDDVEDADEDLDEEDYEDDDVEEEEAEEEPAPAPVSRRRKAAEPTPEPEVEEEPEDEDDVEEPEEDDADSDDEDDQVSYEEASAMSLVELKKLAKEYEYEDSELNPFKGPGGKKKLLAKLVEDEIVAAEGGDDEPPF